MTSKNSSTRYTEDFESMIRIVILNSLGFFFLGFLIPVLASTNMGATGLQVGWITSSLVIGSTFSSTFVGYLTDKVKRKSTLVFIGSIGRGISYFIIYYSLIINSLLILWIGWFFLGVGAGFFWIPYDTIVAEKSNKDHRSHAFGKRDSANGIGQFFGALLGFFLLILIGLFTSNPLLLYSVIIIYGLANFYAGFLFLKNVDESIKFRTSNSEKMDNNQDEIINKSPFSRSIKIGTALLLLLVLLSGVNAFLWRPFLNIYIIENITNDLIIVILIYSPVGLIALFLAPKLGALVDKFNPSIVIIITTSIGALMTWLLINTTNTGLFTVILLFDMTIGITSGLVFRNLLSRINIQHRGKVLGATSLFTNIGSMIGPIIGGYFWDIITPTAPFIISIFVELSLIPFYLIVVKILIPHLAESYEKK